MKRLWIILSSYVLVACGGATSGSVGEVSSGLTVTGTAATGAAIASGAVSAKCKTGTGSGITNAKGNFSLAVVSGTLPCVVKVTALSGAVLYSVAEGSGSSASVNVSPLTDVIVAAAAGSSSESVYTNFDALAQAKVTGLALVNAKNSIAVALRSVMNLANVDPLKDVLVAGSGVGLDAQLDQLSASLKKAGLSTADLGSVIVANGGPVSNAILAAAFGVPVSPMPANTLVDRLGQIFPLRVKVAVAENGAFNGASYEFHKLDGTMTPCTYSSENAATCHGTNGVFSVASQGRPLSQNGAITATSLTAGPDMFGFTFSGTVTGNTWSGTFTKDPAMGESRTDWGTFSADVVFQGGSISIGR